MPFSPSAEAAVSLCSGRLLRRTVCAFFLTATLARAQATPPNPKPTAKKAAEHRANELTLAGLRPGRDKLSRAAQLYRNIDPRSSTNDSQTIWKDPCRKQILTVDFDSDRKIQVIRAGAVPSTGDCLELPPSPWKTGRGLRVRDPTASLLMLYGPPDSKSPSSRDGQPLELWYYAFDWAGPDVPQVMEVLCTREQHGQPGRVVEITLAAPSL
jgi:hypothetical protein